MSAETEALAVRSVPGTAGIIDITGEITSSSEDALVEAYTRASRENAVILNFRDLQYMNSGGIGLLVVLLVRANRQGRRLLAFGLSDHYRQIFELTKLDEAIGIYDDEEQALAAAG